MDTIVDDILISSDLEDLTGSMLETYLVGVSKQLSIIASLLETGSSVEFPVEQTAHFVDTLCNILSLASEWELWDLYRDALTILEYLLSEKN
jgi:hypothetical protein